MVHDAAVRGPDLLRWAGHSTINSGQTGRDGHMERGDEALALLLVFVCGYQQAASNQPAQADQLLAAISKSLALNSRVGSPALQIPTLRHLATGGRLLGSARVRTTRSVMRRIFHPLSDQRPYIDSCNSHNHNHKPQQQNTKEQCKSPKLSHGIYRAWTHAHPNTCIVHSVRSYGFSSKRTSIYSAK